MQTFYRPENVLSTLKNYYNETAEIVLTIEDGLVGTHSVHYVEDDLIHRVELMYSSRNHEGLIVPIDGLTSEGEELAWECVDLPEELDYSEFMNTLFKLS